MLATSISVPVTYSILVTPCSPIYRAVTPAFAEEFIPKPGTSASLAVLLFQQG